MTSRNPDLTWFTEAMTTDVLNLWRHHRATLAPEALTSRTVLAGAIASRAHHDGRSSFTLIADGSLQRMYAHDFARMGGDVTAKMFSAQRAAHRPQDVLPSSHVALHLAGLGAPRGGALHRFLDQLMSSGAVVYTFGVGVGECFENLFGPSSDVAHVRPTVRDLVPAA